MTATIATDQVGSGLSHGSTSVDVSGDRDSVSVFMWNLLRWAQSIELVPIEIGRVGFTGRRRQNLASGTLCF
jgi:hypothetical protein